MDIDSEAVNGSVNSAASSPASQQQQQNVPGAFDTPKVNGRKDSSANIPNGSADSQGPVPPPHKSNPSSPTPVVYTVEDAEAFKTAGNKFYKAKEWRKAIEEYTKGTIVAHNNLV